MANRHLALTEKKIINDHLKDDEPPTVQAGPGRVEHDMSTQRGMEAGIAVLYASSLLN